MTMLGVFLHHLDMCPTMLVMPLCLCSTCWEKRTRSIQSHTALLLLAGLDSNHCPSPCHCNPTRAFTPLPAPHLLRSRNPMARASQRRSPDLPERSPPLRTLLSYERFRQARSPTGHLTNHNHSASHHLHPIRPPDSGDAPMLWRRCPKPGKMGGREDKDKESAFT